VTRQRSGTGTPVVAEDDGSADHCPIQLVQDQPFTGTGRACSLEKSEKRGVQAARNGLSEDRKYWQRVELGIHGLNRWAVNCLEMSRKRGV